MIFILINSHAGGWSLWSPLSSKLPHSNHCLIFSPRRTLKKLDKKSALEKKAFTEKGAFVKDLDLNKKCKIKLRIITKNMQLIHFLTWLTLRLIIQFVFAETNRRRGIYYSPSKLKMLSVSWRFEKVLEIRKKSSAACSFSELSFVNVI